MTLYECTICNFSTTLKNNFTRHNLTKKHVLNKKKNKNIEHNNGLIIEKDPKKTQKDPEKDPKRPNNFQKKDPKRPEKTQKDPKQENEEKRIKKFNCEFCFSKFTTFAHKRRHEKYRCKDNPDLMEQIMGLKNNKIQILETEKQKFEKEKEKWEKEKHELYGKMDVLLTKVGDTNNIQTNIILNNYGSEDLSHITDKIKNELLKIPYAAIPKMIEAIHFNDDKPENKNILLPNKKENLIKVYTGDKWVYKNKIDTINDIIDSKYLLIDNHYEDINEKQTLSQNVQTKYIKFRKFYDKCDKEMVEKLKRECELVLLNNR